MCVGFGSAVFCVSSPFSTVQGDDLALGLKGSQFNLPLGWRETSGKLLLCCQFHTLTKTKPFFLFFPPFSLPPSLSL